MYHFLWGSSWGEDVVAAKKRGQDIGSRVRCVFFFLFGCACFGGFGGLYGG